MNKKFLRKALEETFEDVILKDIPSTLPNANLTSSFKENSLRPKVKHKNKVLRYVAAILVVVILPLGVKLIINNLYSHENSSVITTDVASGNGDKGERIYALELEVVSRVVQDHYVETVYKTNSQYVILKQYAKNEYNSKKISEDKYIITRNDETSKIIATAHGCIFEISGNFTEKELLKLYKSLKLEK